MVFVVCVWCVGSEILHPVPGKFRKKSRSLYYQEEGHLCTSFSFFFQFYRTTYFKYHSIITPSHCIPCKKKLYLKYACNRGKETLLYLIPHNTNQEFKDCSDMHLYSMCYMAWLHFGGLSPPFVFVCPWLPILSVFIIILL